MGSSIPQQCGTLRSGRPIFWVATQRVHHQKSDAKAIRHTPARGRGWGRTWDGSSPARGCHPRRVGPRALAQDLSKTRLQVGCRPGMDSKSSSASPYWRLAGVPKCCGASLPSRWLHATWLVISDAPLGSRRFRRRETRRTNGGSRSSLGEEGTITIHAHPTSARHGLMGRVYSRIGISIMLRARSGGTSASQGAEAVTTRKTPMCRRPGSRVGRAGCMSAHRLLSPHRLYRRPAR